MSFAARRAAVRAEIDAACARCGRDPAGVELLAVSKTHPAAAVRAAAAAGQQSFGESRVQELLAKIDMLADLPIDWHLIGSLQTNKVAAVLAAPRVALIHSLDRAKLADALEKHAAARDRSVDVLLQLEATGEPNKHGVAVEGAPALLDHVVANCPHVHVRGLMAIGPLGREPGPVFERVAALRAALQDRLGTALPVLSLGMSGDLEPAIAAGSTLVRVGTALFGARDPGTKPAQNPDF